MGEVARFQPKHSAEEVLAYWTEERRAKATPMSLPVHEGDAQVADKAEGAGGFTSTQVPDSQLETNPYHAVGRLFVRKPDGKGGYKDSFCSAAAIQDYTVLTAAHCVYNEHGSAEMVIFLPGYFQGGGKGNFEVFVMSACISVPQAYVDAVASGGHRTPSDLAMVAGSYSFSANGVTPLSPMGGGRLDSPYYSTLGYPGLPSPTHSYNGEHQWAVLGDNLGSMETDAIGWRAMVSDTPDGASGSPWLSPPNWSDLEVPPEVYGVSAGFKPEVPAITTPYFGLYFDRLWAHFKDFKPGDPC